MNASTETAVLKNAPADPPSLKSRQQAAWGSGDYAVIGTTLQIVGESLAEACDLRWGERVLDVAAGNGNATLAAARRWCEVTSTDYVTALLERGRMRAEAEGLEIEFQQAAFDYVPTIPIGQYLPQAAWRSNVTGQLKGSAPVFWNVTKG